MSNSKIEAIDLYLLFRGRVNRKDLIIHFDIGTATASRALKEYRDFAPQNLTYLPEKRVYVASNEFMPAFQHEVNRALTLLAYGEDLRTMNINNGYLMPKVPVIGQGIEWKLVHGLTRAFTENKQARIRYHSTGVGGLERIVYPHSIFEIGSVWYFRAGEVEKSNGEIAFKTFRFSRLVSSEVINISDPRLVVNDDIAWTREVTVTIGPNPKHNSVEALRSDLGLNEHPVKNIYVKEALVGMILSNLRVDSSEEGILNPFEYQLRLFNRIELLGIHGMVVAPGFNLKK
jgi:hypothetical protein